MAFVRMAQLEHYTVEHDAGRALVKVTRTKSRLAAPDVASAMAALDAAIVVDRPTHLLLMDMRDGPANNDPAFEEAMTEPVKRLYADFRRRAVVVRSAAGALQINRLAKARGLDHDQQVFVDEAPALSWLLSGASARSSD